MKLSVFISCILSSLLVTMCTPGKNENRGNVAAHMKLNASERKIYRNRYVAELEKIIEATPYQEVHARMYGNKLHEFKRWPELDILKKSELINYCQKYILCIGSKEKVTRENSILVVRPLQYYYIEGNQTPKKKKKFRKCRLVRTLKCQVAKRKIYHFVRGTKQYSAFFVQATSCSKRSFTIVDACRTEVLNTIKSDLTDATQKLTKRAVNRKKLHPDSKIIRNAMPYQEIHVKMYGDNLEAYKIWPELEDKEKEELNIVCYKYIECLKLRDSKILKSHISLSLQMLKYYIVDTTQVNKMNPLQCRHYYPNRLVRTLKCQTNLRIRRFIRASDKYSAFLIEPTNTTYTKFTIARACDIDVLNKISEINLSSYDGNKTSEEYESGDNLQNEVDIELFNAYNSNDTSLSQKSGEKVSDNCNNDSDASLQKCDKGTDSTCKNDVQMEKDEETTFCDSEVTISDDDMYLQEMNSDEYD